MTRQPTTELRSAAALERIADALERIANEREGVSIPMDDGNLAIPTPVSANEIAARTPPHTTPAKRFFPRVEEVVKPLPAEARADELPDDEIEGMTDEDSSPS